MRLDQRLIAEGLADSRSRARRLIESGLVAVDGAVCAKPALSVSDGQSVRLLGDDCPWVSRGALKLLKALEAFDLSPEGAVALDLGASTGGFTEVLLARGARRVYAVDVGRDQLRAELRGDPRVVSLEGVNVKALDAALIPEPIDFFTADLSFISLTKALPAPLALAAPGAVAALLVKPQFEVGRARIGKGGIVKDPAAREDAVAAVAACLEGLGWRALGRAVSPILGGDGNEERLLAARLERRDE